MNHIQRAATSSVGRSLAGARACKVFVATLVAVTLIGGLSPASAAGRSKEERAAWWQTLHESAQPWRPAAPTAGAATAHPAPAAPARTPAAQGSTTAPH